MFTGFVWASTLVLISILLVCSRRWTYVGLCVLVEFGWVALAQALSQLTVWTNESSLLFWALAVLFFSAVELCLCAFAFVLTADVRGE